MLAALDECIAVVEILQDIPSVHSSFSTEDVRMNSCQQHSENAYKLAEVNFCIYTKREALTQNLCKISLHDFIEKSFYFLYVNGNLQESEEIISSNLRHLHVYRPFNNENYCADLRNHVLKQRLKALSVQVDGVIQSCNGFIREHNIQFD